MGLVKNSYQRRRAGREAHLFLIFPLIFLLRSKLLIEKVGFLREISEVLAQQLSDGFVDLLGRYSDDRRLLEVDDLWRGRRRDHRAKARRFDVLWGDSIDIRAAILSICSLRGLVSDRAGRLHRLLAILLVREIRRISLKLLWIILRSII